MDIHSEPDENGIRDNRGENIMLGYGNEEATNSAFTMVRFHTGVASDIRIRTDTFISELKKNVIVLMNGRTYSLRKSSRS